MREKQFQIFVDNKYGNSKLSFGGIPIPAGQWAEWPQPVYGRPREVPLLAEGAYWARDPEPAQVENLGAIEVRDNEEMMFYEHPPAIINYRPAELNPNPF